MFDIQNIIDAEYGLEYREKNIRIGLPVILCTEDKTIMILIGDEKNYIALLQSSFYDNYNPSYAKCMESFDGTKLYWVGSNEAIPFIESIYPKTIVEKIKNEMNK